MSERSDAIVCGVGGVVVGGGGRFALWRGRFFFFLLFFFVVAVEPVSLLFCVRLFFGSRPGFVFIFIRSKEKVTGFDQSLINGSFTELFTSYWVLSA